jgi:outer membrane biosynthesis protein TonB
MLSTAMRNDEHEVCVWKVFNMRLSHLILSLPFLACAAQAQGLDPVQATTLLSKSHSLNLKCNILNDADGQQLRDYVARAEISLAEKVSVAAARKAISSGRAEAQSAACDDTNRKSVNDVLAAAKTAVETTVVAETPAQPEETKTPETTALAVVEPEPAPKKIIAKEPKPVTAPKQIVVIKPQKPVGRVKTIASAQKLKPAKTKGSLDGYAQVAETYYAALKCGNMSRGKMAKLYQSVLTSHQQALASNRPRDVQVMLRSVEARAGSRSCS